jgi:hypothetical protein
MPENHMTRPSLEPTGTACSHFESTSDCLCKPCWGLAWAALALQAKLQGWLQLIMASGFTSGLKICAVIVSSRNKERVDEAVKQLQAQAITCTGVVCHVGSKEHRDRLIATALKVHPWLLLFAPFVVLPFFVRASHIGPH